MVSCLNPVNGVGQFELLVLEMKDSPVILEAQPLVVEHESLELSVLVPAIPKPLKSLPLELQRLSLEHHSPHLELLRPIPHLKFDLYKNCSAQGDFVLDDM